ncbi:hypothetical protein AMTR_s00005p00128520 [Amborella trichopoda]|uniref:Uncharacterized protein n=1 Tax=Amborella trichopoda TaxID=13333 RepID=W1PI36_AMBTC|nr:hypothetical protein AMTR_s00005p00128520 [Amborella trichopoda]
MTPGKAPLERPIQLPECLISRTSIARARFTDVGALSSPEHALPELMCLECRSDVSLLSERCRLQNMHCRSPCVSSAGAMPLYYRSALCNFRSTVAPKQVLPESPLRLPERIVSRTCTAGVLCL